MLFQFDHTIETEVKHDEYMAKIDARYICRVTPEHDDSGTSRILVEDIRLLYLKNIEDVEISDSVYKQCLTAAHAETDFPHLESLAAEAYLNSK